ncbi:MAG TPA: hypothetical protein PK874_02690 [Desulfobacteraceae bacterium]|nr:hypothetical protein [Desulfobacteraceae bacterium]HPJ69171.1 hypothetical protein [Desulfobacteraceae bacterium]HPQ29780.1 hypothetical protein [Desulfobacteraceae bacterium]
MTAGTVTVYFSEDASNLYVAFDMGFLPYAGSAVQVFVDTNYDRSSSPQTDDYRFTVREDGARLENQGTGTGWQGISPSGSWSAATTTGISGWQAEFSIQFSKLGVTAGTPRTIGLALCNAWTTGNYDYWWPGTADWEKPDTWGSLSSSSKWSNLIFNPVNAGILNIILE